MFALIWSKSKRHKLMACPLSYAAQRYTNPSDFGKRRQTHRTTMEVCCRF
jgi:hypothetical protein